ncbi:hypothetical protein BJ878DRAFT_520190 [Calycina marina]|uniref:2EXR domain-containing protein n=1 Tax=Calycina marina TaxID=1763456 RepID=A0A9P7YYP2_9HELO|nr:hypothetical protein BJ878DRAFT_520190 [Calycina marina]
MSGTNFHNFSLLPKELRLQIWRASFPSARRILCNRCTPGPAALYVNQESRAFAREFYDWRQHPAARHLFSCYGWMDYSTDIIDGDGIREGHYLPGHAEACRKIRHIHCSIGSVYELFTLLADHHLDLFSDAFLNLEQIDVMVHEHGTDGDVVVETIKETLEGAIAGRIKEIKSEREREDNLLFHPPTLSIELCPTTKEFVANGSVSECKNIYCELYR